MELRDPLASSSHLLTGLWAIYATLLLLRLTESGEGRKLAVAVYGLTMVVLYFASGIFHGLIFTNPDDFRFFQKLDQSAIYLLIAGTNTPVLVFVLEGAWRRWCLRTMWAFAAAGLGMGAAPVP